MTPNDCARARRQLTRSDPVLAGAIRRIGRCGLAEPPAGDLFEGLVRAIAGQQLSVKAARTIYARVAALAEDGGRLTPERLLAVPPADLRAAGLSARKASYVLDLAGRVSGGGLVLSALPDLDDEEVIAALTDVKGIGRWTAEMILIFRLGRPDVLPLDDAGVVRAVRRLYGLRRAPSPRRLEGIAEAWRPWRSVACWYLWATLDGVP